MGTWALEHDPGTTGDLYQMHVWREDLWAFCYGGGGNGVWRRTPPNWTNTYGPAAASGRGEIWDNQMWWPQNPAGQVWFMYRSADGLTWVQDFDFTTIPPGGAYSHWSALGGYDGDDLYMFMHAFQGALEAVFYRDTLGNYTMVPNQVPDNNHGEDIIGFGGSVYFCDATGDCYERPPAAWQAEPTLDDWCQAFTYNPNDGLVYAMYLDALGDNIWRVYRRSLTSGWVLDHNFGLSGAYGMGHISVGAGSTLWVCAEDGVDSMIFVKIGNTWHLHSTQNGVRFQSACAFEGSIFAGTNSCEFWAYTFDFAAGAGAGLANQSMACDGDGDGLYICAYNGAGRPVLVRANLPLTQAAVGLGVFQPGGGSAINVRTVIKGNELVVTGDFGASQCEVSDDGGASFSDISDGGWGGGELVMPVLPDPALLADILVTLQTAQDVVLTEDGGTWVVQNPAIGFSPTAGARLARSDELVIGGPTGQVRYSPNAGIELADISAGWPAGDGVEAMDVV